MLVKQAKCSVHFIIKCKQTSFPWCLMPIGTIQQSEHTKYSTYQQQCNGSKCSSWGMKMTTLPKLVEFSFIPYMSASVIECRSIGSCSSSGLCAGLMITGLHFQLLFTLPPSDAECQWGVWKQFSRTCAIIQIKYVLPKLCHLPQYSYGSRDPTTRLLGYASYPGLGTRDPYSYWGRWHSMATHT